MSRYIDLLTLTEALDGVHFSAEAADPSRWQELPPDHWFWQPLPAGCRVAVVDGAPALVAYTDERSLDELRDEALFAVYAAADAALHPITCQYPRAEIDSWTEQCLEAREWLANTSAHTPLLAAIAGRVNSEGMEALCLSVLSKADTYKSQVGSVIAWRRANTDWIGAQTDPARLRDFVPSFPEVPDAP